MFQEVIDKIPKQFINFLLTVLFSLLIGLEQRRKQNNLTPDGTFGTDRTFTLIGILGYILYLLGPINLLPFLVGGIALSLQLGIYYQQRIRKQQKYGFTAVITALITYCLAPLIFTQPQWLVLLIVISVLILTEIKEYLFQFTKKFDDDEFITLSKFMALTGVILPLLPDTQVFRWLPVTPYHFWLAIVVVSAISYFSYLLQKFVFPKAGMLLTGILGGLYSSTATTVIISRKSKLKPGEPRIVPAILLAVSMMYIRIFILSFLFYQKVAMQLLPYFIILIIVCCSVAWIIYKKHSIFGLNHEEESEIKPQHNPLEFKTAVTFGFLFVLFALLTNYILKTFGTDGLNAMSLIVGVTDIDPFIMNLLQGKWEISEPVIAFAILLAINSNNIIKLIYALVLSEKKQRLPLLVGLGSLILSGFLLSVLKPF